MAQSRDSVEVVVAPTTGIPNLLPEPEHSRCDAMGGHGYCKNLCYNHAYAINGTHDGMHKACEMMACDFESGECEVDLACGTKQDPDGFCRDLCFADDGDHDAAVCDMMTCLADANTTLNGTCGIDSSCRGKDEYFCQRMCHDFGGGVLCDQLHCDAYSDNCSRLHGSIGALA